MVCLRYLNSQVIEETVFFIIVPLEAILRLTYNLVFANFSLKVGSELGFSQRHLSSIQVRSNPIFLRFLEVTCFHYLNNLTVTVKYVLAFKAYLVTIFKTSYLPFCVPFLESNLYYKVTENEVILIRNLNSSKKP